MWLSKRDTHYLRRKSYHQALKKVFIDEISFLNGDYSPFENGKQFIDKSHPFAFDLDLFGENSIYQMMNRTATKEGGAILANELGTIPDNEEEILSRQESLEELAKRGFQASVYGNLQRIRKRAKQAPSD